MENNSTSKIKEESSPETITMSSDDDDSDFETQPEKQIKKPSKPAKASDKLKSNAAFLSIKSSGPSVKRKRTPDPKEATGSKKIKTVGNVAIEAEQDSAVNLGPCFSDIEQNVPLSSAGSSKSFTADLSKIISNAKRLHKPWKDEEVVAEVTNVNITVAKNAISLLEQECTIPFIVRYRRENTGGLLAEKLRDIQTSFEEVKLVHEKVENILKTVKSEKIDENTASALLSAKTLEEVDFLYSPLKSGSERNLAELSNQLGLDEIAMQLLESKVHLSALNFASYIKPQKGLQNVKEIQDGIQYIIADIIAKDRRVLDFVRTTSTHPHIRILSAKSASAEEKDKKAHVEGKTTENFKYENYFNLNILIKHLAHHQVMAINRGENQKVLTVKIQIPFAVNWEIKSFICDTFFSNKLEPETFKFLKSCSEDSYERLIEPHMCRQIRSDLTKKAEKECISVFCSNVKSMLLTPPVRGKTVISIDPGFSHGCKIAAVSSKGEVLKTDVIYPHSKNTSEKGFGVAAVKLKGMISLFGSEIVAIGNGTACRETELWLSNLITSKFFHPFELKYCIVNEAGVSIYSVTNEAELELPNMDPNVRSAVAIARRLQDPLLEYVKIEPKHLGVGMYQHDVSENQLKKALDSVVEECISFVGVDLNVCPEFLLKKISGLNAAKAKQIIEWRNENGSFVNRQQLLEVKGLGPKSFEQCAGFVKILPETSTPVRSKSVELSVKTSVQASSIQKANPLDRTIIHPESYDAAEIFLKELRASPQEVGKQILVDKVNSYMEFKCTEDVAKSLNVPVPVMQLIVDAFKQLSDFDIRGEFDQPLFMTSVRKFSDLARGQELTGRVMNVAGFGVFVDIGVEKSGLIHTSKMNGHTVNVGEKVTVEVLNVEIEKKIVHLQLLKKQE